MTIIKKVITLIIKMRNKITKYIQTYKKKMFLNHQKKQILKIFPWYETKKMKKA